MELTPRRSGNRRHQISNALSFSRFESTCETLLTECLLFLPTDLLPFLSEVLRDEIVTSSSGARMRDFWFWAGTRSDSQVHRVASTNADSESFLYARRKICTGRTFSGTGFVAGGSIERSRDHGALAGVADNLSDRLHRWPLAGGLATFA